MRRFCTVITAFWLTCQPLVAQAERPQLPGVELKDLDEDETAILYKILQEQFDPCGKPQSFMDSVLKPKDCRIATGLANFVVGQIARGLSKKQIKRALLKEIKRMTVRHKFSELGRPSIGSAKSKVTIIEFYDFQCPHCAQVADEVADLVMKKKVRLVYKQYPLDFHEAAKPAAIAALAAHEQGKFKVLHDLLFKHYDSLDADQISKLVVKSGVDMKRFKSAQKAAAKTVASDKREGDMADIDGTPAFFVNGLKCEYENLAECIDTALAGK